MPCPGYTVDEQNQHFSNLIPQIVIQFLIQLLSYSLYVCKFQNRGRKEAKEKGERSEGMFLAGNRKLSSGNGGRVFLATDFG